MTVLDVGDGMAGENEVNLVVTDRMLYNVNSSAPLSGVRRSIFAKAQSSEVGH